MDQFYMIVIGIAIVFLILIMVFMGLMMQDQNQNTVFPPTSSTCPDGWGVTTDGSCNIPQNATALGGKNVGNLEFTNGGNNFKGLNHTSSYPKNLNISGNKFSPSDPKWTWGTTTSNICGQQLWAQKYNITWDGVSNYNSC